MAVNVRSWIYPGSLYCPLTQLIKNVLALLVSLSLKQSYSIVRGKSRGRQNAGNTLIPDPGTENAENCPRGMGTAGIN